MNAVFDLGALDIINCRVCAQNIGWEGRVGEHVVRWETAPPSHPYQMRYVCDCKGFQFRRHCGHITIADSMRCHWGEGAYSGSPSEPNLDGSCPECGGPTTNVRVKI